VNEGDRVGGRREANDPAEHELANEARRLRERLRVITFERRNLAEALGRLEEQRRRTDAELEEQRRRTDTELEQLRQRRSELEAQLRNRTDRVRALEGQVSDFLVSRSWRIGRAITLPWRRMKALARGSR